MTIRARPALLLSLLPLVLGLVAGCPEVTDSLSLRIVRADPTAFQGADVLRITVVDEGLHQVVDPLEMGITSGTQAQFGDLLPTQGQVRFLVEALSGNSVVARGGSAFVTLGSGDLDLAILVGRVGTFHATLDPEGLPSALPFPLAGATTTRLKDGRVLIVGGASLDAAGAITDISKSALIYDPNRGTFITLSSELRIRRAFHTATLLKPTNTGGPQRVLIAGGITLINGERMEATRLAEIFDPDTNAFTVHLLEMGAARYGHTATLLISGDVLLAGGGDLAVGQLLTSGLGPDALQVGRVHGDADIFRFSDTNPRFDGTMPVMKQPRIFHAAGRGGGTGNLVLLAGGRSETSAHLTTEVYNPAGAAGSFADGADLAEPRIFATATRLGNGELLIAGGLNEIGNPASASSSVERYTLGDSAPGVVTLVPMGNRLITRRYRHQAVLMSDAQQVLIVGGFGESGFTRATAERISDGSPTEVLADAGERVYHDVARLLSGDVLLVGGVSRPTSGGVQAILGGTIYTPILVGD